MTPVPPPPPDAPPHPSATITDLDRAQADFARSVRCVRDDIERWRRQLVLEQNEKPGSELRQNYVDGEISVINAVLSTLNTIIRDFDRAVSPPPPAMRPEEV